jgi:hypothetical protein
MVRVISANEKSEAAQLARDEVSSWTQLAVRLVQILGYLYSDLRIRFG